MRKLLFLFLSTLLLSCSADEGSITETEVDLTIDHYKTTSLLNGTALVASEIGSDQKFEVPFISGFEFQPGFQYSITATRTTTINDGAATGTDSYRLISVRSQDTIPPNTRFTVPLAEFVNGFGYVKFVVGNAELGYTLSNEISLDCTSFCGQLYSMLSIEDPITGEFEHGPDGTYVLTALY